MKSGDESIEILDEPIDKVAAPQRKLSFSLSDLDSDSVRSHDSEYVKCFFSLISFSRLTIH
jgi:hypothetical protein